VILAGAVCHKILLFERFRILCAVLLLLKSRQKNIRSQLALRKMFTDISPKKEMLSNVADQHFTSKKTVENEVIP